MTDDRAQPRSVNERPFEAPVKPPVARPVGESTRQTARIPTPPTPEPHDDPTPIHVTIPDHTYFPCVHCGKLNRCPPSAIEHARALERLKPISNQVGKPPVIHGGKPGAKPPDLAARIAGNAAPSGVIAPELEPPAPPPPPSVAPTKILRMDDPP